MDCTLYLRFSYVHMFEGILTGETMGASILHSTLLLIFICQRVYLFVLCQPGPRENWPLSATRWCAVASQGLPPFVDIILSYFCSCCLVFFCQLLIHALRHIAWYERWSWAHEGAIIFVSYSSQRDTMRCAELYLASEPEFKASV